MKKKQVEIFLTNRIKDCILEKAKEFTKYCKQFVIIDNKLFLKINDEKVLKVVADDANYKEIKKLFYDLHDANYKELKNYFMIYMMHFEIIKKLWEKKIESYVSFKREHFEKMSKNCFGF